MLVGSRRLLTVEGLHDTIEIENEAWSEQGGANGVLRIDTKFASVRFAGVEQGFVHFI